MTRASDTLHLFADELNPTAVKSILRWREHPELGRLVTKLLSHTSRKAFLDSYAEAMTALQLLRGGCDLRMEVPTPQGKRCDFEIRCGKVRFYLNVKRLESHSSEQEEPSARTVASPLRALERIRRPYIVQVHWTNGASVPQMRMLAEQAAEFIRQARVGDEMTARDDAGRRLGAVRIIAPWEGDHVSVMIGLRSAFTDQTPRFRRLMQRAYQQFMPRAFNVILVCSDHVDDVADFESALLGSHIERWDAFPPRGKRVAHGRDVDGFWSDKRYAESQVAGWFHFNPRKKFMRSRFWMRDEQAIDPEVTSLLKDLFGAKNQ